MDSNTPILMITLQIPVMADTTTDQVLDAIGQKVSEALSEFRQQREIAEVETLEAPDQQEFNASVVKETLENYTDLTTSDMLNAMGYKPRE